MTYTDDQLTQLSESSESWLRGKIDDCEVDKCIALIKSANNVKDGSNNNAPVNDVQITGIIGTVICAIFYWRVTLDTPSPGARHFTGNAGGFGSAGGGGIQGGVLIPTNDLNTLYNTTVSFQFNSAAIGLNLNFFDSNSNLVGTFVGGGVGICMGTGGGSGSWT